MSEEEKKAIKNLKNIVEDLEETEQGAIINLFQEEIESLKIILTLIKKQQKEIKEYQKCFKDIERHQKNQMQMQKSLWKRLLKGEINE